MMKLTQINLYDNGGLKGYGPLGLEQGQDGVSTFATFISSSIGLISLVGIIWFVFIFIFGALGIITSGGDKNSMENAKKKISSGLIGVVVILLGLLIIRFFGTIFGIDLLNFGEMFKTLIIS